MRTRIAKTVNGKFYVMAASVSERELWLNPKKVRIERKPLFS